MMWDHLNDPPGQVNISGHPNVDELLERIRMLNDITLSAIALKLMIENGLPPTLDALNRDLRAYGKKFKSALPVLRQAALRPANFDKLSAEEQWEIDKSLGILDWDGK